MTENTYDLGVSEDDDSIDSIDGGDSVGTTTDDETATEPGQEEAVGVTIPDEHVGAFVAQAFEDPERDTSWDDVVDTLVADDALPAWRDLDATGQAVEVLSAADDYDRRAVELLEATPLTGGELPGERRESIEEALRCRRNADILRDGLAAAYHEGHLSEGDLREAVETFEFDTETVAEREDLLESVAELYDFDFKPYGGTLFSEDEETVPESEEVW
jgi:hypothetical protein